MRIVASLLFCTLLFGLIPSIQGKIIQDSTNDPVYINFVSTTTTQHTSVLAGSIEGGTTLYIQGYGFDSAPENNIVFVGNTRCNTNPKGVTQFKIVCITGAYTSGPLTDLPIRIEVLNKQSYTCSTPNCLFSYTNSETSILNAVHPRSLTLNQQLNFFGIHKVSSVGDGKNTGDVVGLYVGDSLCGLVDIDQRTVNSNINSFITCSIFPTQEAGYYNVAESTTSGNARKVFKMKYGSVIQANKNFQLVLAPSITGVNVHSGGSKGANLVITGTGFSTDLTKNQVTAAGLSCTVTSVTSTQIKCRLAEDTVNNKYGKFDSSATPQVGGYSSGSGLSYERYQIKSAQIINTATFKLHMNKGADYVVKVPTDNSVTPLVRGDLSSADLFPQKSFAEVFKGYFIAPTTGAYLFRAMGDESVELNIASVTGSFVDMSTETNRILYSPTRTADPTQPSNYFYNSQGLVSSPIQMTAGASYYIEAYHTSSKNGGSFRMAVEIPNVNDNIPNQAYEVQKVTFVQEVIPEILEFVVDNWNKGEIMFKMIIMDLATLQTTYFAKATLSVAGNKRDAAAFQDLLIKFAPFADYKPTVTAQYFDSQGNILTDVATASKIKYRVSMSLYRPATYTSDTTLYKFSYDYSKAENTVAGGAFPSVTSSVAQKHSPPLEGTFTLKVNGFALQYLLNGVLVSDIPFDVSPSTLAGYFADSSDINLKKYVQVAVSGPGYLNGNTFTFQFVEFKGDLSDIVVDVSKMKGGDPSKTITAQVETLRHGSKNIFMDPINSEVLQTYTDKPSVTVKVNDVTSMCNGDCSYEVVSSLTPTLNSVTRTNNVLKLNIATNAPLAAFDVIFGGQTCSYSALQSTGVADYACTLPTTTGSSPLLEAGSITPIVHIPSKGFADTSLITNIVEYPVTIDTLTPATGDILGGLTVTMAGSGFPYNSDNAKKDFTLKLCNKDVTIVSVSNTQIKFITNNQCTAGPQSVVLTFKTKTASKPFTVASTLTAPTLTAIAPTDYKPDAKGVMTITGTGFGTDKTKVTVSLKLGTNIVHKLLVDSTIDTEIKAKVPANLVSGEYTVIVFREGFGNATVTPVGADAFKYQVTITALSASTGSVSGGTILTLTGKNFSPNKDQNQVFIGDTIKYSCPIISFSNTQIVCRTPAIKTGYTPVDQLVHVIVKGREKSKCILPATCLFKYSITSSAVTSMAPVKDSYMAGDIITLTGTGFIANAQPPIVTLGGKIATINSHTATSIVFVFPQLQNGVYPLLVQVNGVGYATTNIQMTTLISMNSVYPITPEAGSYIANTITLNGHGLGDIGSKFVSFNAISSAAPRIPFNYTIRSDNTPTKFGINFQGCEDGAKITLNYYYQNKLYQQNYSCLAALTQKISLPVNTIPFSTSNKVLTFQRRTLASEIPKFIYSYPIDSDFKRIGINVAASSITPGSAGTFTADFGPLTNGKYSFRTIYDTEMGSAQFNSYLTISQSVTPVLDIPIPATPIESSFAGGALITVKGDGLSSFSKLTVAGVPATLTLVTPPVAPATATSLVYSIPPLVTPLTQYQLKLAQETVLKGTLISDIPMNNSNSFDSLISTQYSSSASVCFLGLDFGSSQQAHITKIRYFPNIAWKSAADYLSGAVFKGSNDGTNYFTIATINSTVHAGWNTWKPELALSTNYRYVRFEHNTTSKCELAELEIIGYLYAGQTATTVIETRSVKFSDGIQTTDFPNAVVYKSTATPVINKIQPKFGTIAGGDVLTLTGTSFGTVSANVKVMIDNIACAVTAATGTQIKCTTGARPVRPSANTFVVTVSNNLAVVRTNNFLYAERWSNYDTWKGDFLPIAGETVYIPKGLSLLVDQSTPKLHSILVQGALLFADQGDYVVEAGSIIIDKGIFRAGTETDPYQSKLTFILNDDVNAAKLGYWNKVIGCHTCIFDMHGKRITDVWVKIAKTAAVGATTIDLPSAVDWLAGQEIVIGSTGLDYKEAEHRTIKTVSVDKKQITFDEPLKYSHTAMTEKFGISEFNRTAQVGLLTRNIKVQGDTISSTKRFGAGITIYGSAEKGLVSRISYSEFTLCGQPSTERDCIQYHMNGDLNTSYFKGNSIHRTIARGITLQDVSYLRVQDNVGYLISGHNIYLKDGSQQHNLIERNLMLSSLNAYNLLQTDVSVASYAITNPLNILRWNRAAGSDYYGFLLDIKRNPQSASFVADMCPTGLPLGELQNNTAHSNKKIGLRISQLVSSQNPCKPIRNDNDVDPWLSNPSVQNRFADNILWGNGETGLLAQHIGNTLFENFVVGSNLKAGLEFYKTNFTKEPVIAKNITIIGQSSSTHVPVSSISSMNGLITSRTDGSGYQLLRFFNFPDTSTGISVGSRNGQIKLRATGCKNYNFTQIEMTNVVGKLLNYVNSRRYIINDLDGSLAKQLDGQTRTSAVITPYFPHNSISGKCTNATNQIRSSNSLICNAGVAVNDLEFSAAEPFTTFKDAKIFVKRLDTDHQLIESSAPDTVSEESVFETEAQQKNTWALPFVSGNTYSVYWRTTIYWTTITMKPSFYFKDTDNAFIVRFNYTAPRELFDIGKILAGKLQTPLLTPKDSMPSYATCKFGDYYLDVNHRFLFVCVSGKDKAIYDSLNLNGITCRNLCPKAGGFIKENFVRLWSNVTQWPNQQIPKAGDNVTIPGNWTILLDIDVENLDNITIDGDVHMTDSNRKVSANFVWIRYGSLNVGNSTLPFQYDFTLTLNGPNTAATHTIDSILSVNKYLVVTGILNLFGRVPTTTSTKLTANALVGSNTITVASANGWVVGNTIGISPSFGKSNEYETVTISSISGNTVTFTPALQYNHYGDNLGFSNTYGSIDMRASVGVFERNIKIVKGGDSNTAGFGVMIYAWNNGQNIVTGSAVIRGVQFVQGGQSNAQNAAFSVLNTAAGNAQTTLFGSTFQNCGGYCFYFSNAKNVAVDNNYAYIGKKFITYAENVKEYKFTNNILIGAIKKTVAAGAAEEDTACYSQYTSPNWANDNVVVEDNFCQGSDLTGFEFPHIPCDRLGLSLGSKFINNTAGSTQIGFLFSGEMDCAGGEKLKVYGSKIGVVSNPKVKSLIWSDLMILDTARGIGLRFGGYDKNANNSVTLRNSYISAVSRSSCAICYGDNATPCKDMKAMRLLSTTENTATLPGTFGDNFQLITQAELFDSQAWISNVTFDNYKAAYTGDLSSKCSNNVLFETHPVASSSIGNHHFFKTKCANCDANAIGYYSPPVESHSGWLGGCGNIPCSGRSNYIMYDHDGSLLGFKGVIIPNNPIIGDNTPDCTFLSSINGHFCKRTDFARLKYTSITSDFDTRITWPVNLTADGSNYTTITNGWRESQWNGTEPLNRRMGRFLSIVQLSKIYNMSFTSQPPTDMLFSFSSVTNSQIGDNSKWIGIKIYYPVPSSIIVTHSNGSATTSILESDTRNISDFNASCGANKYLSKNNSIHFIVTADSRCQVRVTLSSSIKVTARLSMNISEFQRTNGAAKFIEQMSTFLNITPNRVQILGVYEGSTIVDATITAPTMPTAQSSMAVPNDAALVQELRNLAAKVATASPSDLPGLPNFIGATSTVSVMNVNGTVQVVPQIPAQNFTTRNIIIGVVVGVVGSALLAVSIYFIVKRVRAGAIVILPDTPVIHIDDNIDIGSGITKGVFKAQQISQQSAIELKRVSKNIQNIRPKIEITNIE